MKSRSPYVMGSARLVFPLAFSNEPGALARVTPLTLMIERWEAMSLAHMTVPIRGHLVVWRLTGVAADDGRCGHEPPRLNA